MSDPTGAGPTADKRADSRIALGAIFRTFLTAGAISFGGGVVAYLREYIVSGTGWLNDESFLDALEVSETLPGLNAVNMSVIIGDKLRGIPGAMAAVAGIMLPGALFVMGLGVAWERQPHQPYVTAFLIGVAAAAVGLLTTVTLQLGHKQFAKALDLGIILATFIAVSIFRVPLYVVVVGIGAVAIWIKRPGAASHEPLRQRAHHIRERLRHRRSLIRH